MNVKAIENLDLEAKIKAELILIGAKVKPATHKDILIKALVKPKELDKSQQLFYKKYNFYQDTLNKIEIPFLIERNPEIQDEYIKKVIMNIYFGQNNDWLNFIINSKNKLHEKSFDKAMGKAFGFPNTAIEAYINKGPFYDGPINTKIKPFAQWRQSAKHYVDELKVAQIWYETLKEYSPLILNELKKDGASNTRNLQTEIYSALNVLSDTI